MRGSERERDDSESKDAFVNPFSTLQKNIDNDTGNKNNLVSVRQSDFEVFQALAKDIEEGNNNEAKEYTQVRQRQKKRR